MPRTFLSEVALASGSVALGVAAGWIGGKVGGELSRALAEPLKERAELRKLILEGVHGAIARTISAPIEHVKLMLQYDDDDELGEPEPLDGALDCVRRIYAREGWRGFFRGNLLNVLRFVPAQAMNYAAKDRIKAAIKALRRALPDVPGKNLAANLLAGGVAGATSLSVVYPLDFVRTQLALVKQPDGTPTYAGAADLLADLVRAPEDYLKLYSGYAVAVAGIVPFRATYFTVHSCLVARNPYMKDDGLKGLASKFAAAQCAALAAAYASYPFDTVRRRLQADARRPDGERRYDGALDCLAKIYRDEGVGALYRGAGYNALRTITSALTLVVYGEVRKARGNRETVPTRGQ